eukprot:scaffold342520_cov22-Prasinocladus_malaysianus.AAC.1
MNEICEGSMLNLALGCFCTRANTITDLSRTMTDHPITSANLSTGTPCSTPVHPGRQPTARGILSTAGRSSLNASAGRAITGKWCSESLVISANSESAEAGRNRRVVSAKNNEANIQPTGGG